jgi:hypothetical protein
MNADALLTALAGIAGVFVGAAVQYWAGKSLEQRKHFQELRSRAYVDFLTAVATIAQSHGTHAGARTELTDAKVRISVYGTATVVHALAAFAATDQVLGSVSTNRAFAQLVQAMRKDSAAGYVDKEQVLAILLEQ